MLLLAMPCDVRAVDPQTVLDTLRFPADTCAEVGRGRFVEVALPSASDRDLNVGIAFLVARQAPAALAHTVRAEKRVITADPSVLAYGDFTGDGAAADLGALRLTPAQLGAFAHAAPGTAVNLSGAEIETLRAAAGDPPAVYDAVRALLLARFRAYRARGLAGITPYARSGSVTSASEDLAAVNRLARAARVLPTPLYDLLDHYPDDRPRGLPESFYWVQMRANGEDVVVLEHIFQTTFDDATILVQRQYYVSAGYNAEQAIVGFLPVGDGTLVVYSNHTSTDQLLGLGVSAKRAIGRTLMANQLKRVFAKTRADFGAVPAGISACRGAVEAVEGMGGAGGRPQQDR